MITTWSEEKRNLAEIGYIYPKAEGGCSGSNPIGASLKKKTFLIRLDPGAVEKFEEKKAEGRPTKKYCQEVTS